MDLELARANSKDTTEHNKHSAAPAADTMSLEAWEHSFKGTHKDMRVPLMLANKPFSTSDAGTLLPADDPITQLYMKARESMGRVIAENGDVVGSGFFLDTNGLFSTLDHVTGTSTDIAVQTGDGQMHKAKIVEKDAANDTVLLQVEKNNPQETFDPVKVAPFGNLEKGEKLLACGFGENTVLHCSPGIYDSTLQQKDIKIKLLPGEPTPVFDPERLLAHATQHTVNGDSGGLEFRVSDGTVRLLIDMTDNLKHTVSIPAERLLELEAKHDAPAIPSPVPAQGSDSSLNQPFKSS